MADPTPTAEQVSGVQEQSGAEGAEQQTPTAPEGSSNEPASEGLDSLPESWQREVKSLRAENADRRTKYNELKTQLDAAKSQEDIDAAVEQYKTQVVDLERSLSLSRHTQGLPEEAHELVTGTTDEEIKASADKVRKLLEGAGSRKKEPDLDATGGLNPKGSGRGASELDARELARGALARRRGR